MAKKQKLELTWVGKDERPKLEPRILIEDPSKSYHAKVRHGDDDIFDNILIKGDNLLALKALEQDYAGKVKCVFIDPPYNTGSAFEHYDDGLEHSLWLSLIRDRLEIIKTLLAPEGTLWVTLDDNEAHYFKVMCDEVFGRQSYFGGIVWQHSVQGKNDAKTISVHHNHLMVYAKSSDYIRNLLPRTEENNKNYSNPDNDPNGDWRSGDVRSPGFRENLRYDVETPGGKIISPPEKGWRWSKETLNGKIATGEVSFLDNETRLLRKIYLKDQKGRVPESIWFGKEAGTTRGASNHLKALLTDSNSVFATPKPEELVNRIIHIATNSGDLVLDSFAGSGTTGAVAHKMNRKWIMVEIGDHADTHIVPRMQKVIDGEDPGGITKSVDWKGGGGFRYYTLAPSLLEMDSYGNWVISKDYNPAMLSEAMCKHMGFHYAPSQVEDDYWQHGHSTETDFIYVTTQNLTHDACKKLSDEVGEGRSLLICCKAYSANSDAFENLTLVKIPTAILAKCEWGQDDYSLNVENLPMADSLEDDSEVDSADDLPLFAEGSDDA